MSQQVAARGAGIELPAAGEWRIDPSHSSVAFAVRHLMVARTRGRFTEFEGTLHVAERAEDSWVEATIGAASIDTAEAKRDEHLRSPDFLDVARFPRLTFRSTGLEPAGAERFRLLGDLSIRDVTRPVVLEVAYEGLVADPWGGTRAAFTGSAEIDREEFGITWNQALEAGGVLVGKRVRIEVEIEAVRV